MYKWPAFLLGIISLSKAVLHSKCAVVGCWMKPYYYQLHVFSSTLDGEEIFYPMTKYVCRFHGYTIKDARVLPKAERDDPSDMKRLAQSLKGIKK